MIMDKATHLTFFTTTEHHSESPANMRQQIAIETQYNLNNQQLAKLLVPYVVFNPLDAKLFFAKLL